MATLRNKRKVAAVSSETPEKTRSSRARNAIDPEKAQEYISQVSEDIEGRVFKKLSKKFTRTEYRNLGALSKLDEFLLNPQVWTCSVAVAGTSGNKNSENRGASGERSLHEPCPEVWFSSHHSGNLNSPEREDYPTLSYKHWEWSVKSVRLLVELWCLRLKSISFNQYFSFHEENSYKAHVHMYTSQQIYEACGRELRRKRKFVEFQGN